MPITPAKGSEFKRRGCRAKLTSSQGFASSTTSVKVAFDTYSYDDGMFVAASNSIKILTDGRYTIEAETSWDAHTTGVRDIKIYVNGSSVVEKNDVAAGVGTVKRSTAGSVLALAKDDLVDLRVWQNSGVTLNFQSTYGRLSVQEVD
jgi:hypothetical protein